MSDGVFLAIVNPAAGGGRQRNMLLPALERLRSGKVQVEVKETSAPGQAAEIAREAYRRGQRRFIAVGGDGTSYEIVNGLFPETQNGERPTLGFLPLGTGNSFLRDFSERGLEYASQALATGKRRPCDVLRLTHREGVLHYINLLSMGFAADVAATRIRRFKNMGELGYLLALFVCLARLERRAFPVRVNGNGTADR